MYIAFDNDPDKDNRITKIIFVICVIFMLMMVTCSGQCIQRSHKSDNESTFSLCKPLILHLINDTSSKMELGIFVDSISDGLSTYIYCEDKLKELTIGFDDASTYVIFASLCKENYSEFKIPDIVLNKLKSNKMDYFDTRKNKIITFWLMDYDDKSYFKDFLNVYTKKIDVEVLGICLNKFR